MNLGKLVPGVGAIVGGGLDLVETKVIANRAYNWFFKGDFSAEDEKDEELIVDVDKTDFMNVELEGQAENEY